MDLVTLTAKSSEGLPLKACFDPQGLNLIGLSLDQIELLEKGQKFIIGPHFGQRKVFFSQTDPRPETDPFINGLASYAPWTITALDANSFTAEIKGKDVREGANLAKFQGQDFIMRAKALLNEEGLFFHLSIVSETASLIGVNTCFNLPEKGGKLQASVQPYFLDNSIKMPLEAGSDFQNNTIYLDLNKDLLQTFWPFPDLCEAALSFATDTYKVIFSYKTSSAENCFQIERNSSKKNFAIKSISSQDPWHPNLTVSALQMQWQIQKS